MTLSRPRIVSLARSVSAAAMSLAFLFVAEAKAETEAQAAQPQSTPHLKAVFDLSTSVSIPNQPTNVRAPENDLAPVRTPTSKPLPGQQQSHRVGHDSNHFRAPTDAVVTAA